MHSGYTCGDLLSEYNWVPPATLPRAGFRMTIQESAGRPGEEAWEEQAVFKPGTSVLCHAHCCKRVSEPQLAAPVKVSLGQQPGPLHIQQELRFLLQTVWILCLLHGLVPQNACTEASSGPLHHPGLGGRLIKDVLDPQPQYYSRIIEF